MIRSRLTNRDCTLRLVSHATVIAERRRSSQGFVSWEVRHQEDALREAQSAAELTRLFPVQRPETDLGSLGSTAETGRPTTSRPSWT
jgi:hypothetical protein